jgi:hypothetical protein
MREDPSWPVGSPWSNTHMLEMCRSGKATQWLKQTVEAQWQVGGRVRGAAAAGWGAAAACWGAAAPRRSEGGPSRCRRGSDPDPRCSLPNPPLFHLPPRPARSAAR